METAASFFKVSVSVYVLLVCVYHMLSLITGTYITGNRPVT